MPMVTTLELDDLVTPGESPRETDRAHGCFRTRTGHTHQVNTWHQVTDALRKLYLERSWRAETQAFLHGLGNGSDNFGMSMTAYHRSPGANIIDITSAIDVYQVGALSPIDKRWCTPNRGKCAHR